MLQHDLDESNRLFVQGPGVHRQSFFLLLLGLPLLPGLVGFDALLFTVDLVRGWCYLAVCARLALALLAWDGVATHFVQGGVGGWFRLVDRVSEAVL